MSQNQSHQNYNDHEERETEGDSASRPSYSYAALISLALESLRGRRATRHDLCQHISSTFPYYRRTDICNWKKMIRKTLADNAAFQCVEYVGPRHEGLWSKVPIDDSATTSR